LSFLSGDGIRLLMATTPGVLKQLIKVRERGVRGKEKEREEKREKEKERKRTSKGRSCLGKEGREYITHRDVSKGSV
jgi:hypothetical protein